MVFCLLELVEAGMGEPRDDGVLRKGGIEEVLAVGPALSRLERLLVSAIGNAT